MFPVAHLIRGSKVTNAVCSWPNPSALEVVTISHPRYNGTGEGAVESVPGSRKGG